MPRDTRYQVVIDREPDPEITAEVVEMVVTQSIDAPWTFRIRMAIDVCDGNLTLIDDVRLTPGEPDTEVSVLSVVEGETTCLIHGIITERQMNLSEGGPGSWLEIAGTDRRALMDRETRAEAHAGLASDIVEKLLGDYEFEKDIVPTKIEYREDKNTLNQNSTDLEFVIQLAGRNDCRFWVDATAESDFFGGLEIIETAHFKPSPERPEDSPFGALAALGALLAPDDTPPLKINSSDGCSTTGTFELQATAEAPNQSGPMPRVNLDDAKIDEARVTETTNERLGEDVQAPQVRSRRMPTAGDAEEAQIQNQAAINDAQWSVRARAETTTDALGGVIQAHQFLEVEGAGVLASGRYFVESVTHTINPAEHRMNISLLRNALGG
jgi:hypothetical protein